MKVYSKQLFELCTHSNRKISHLLKCDDVLKSLYDTETSFLPIKTSLVDRIWYIINDIHEIVKCPVCGINDTTLNMRPNAKYIIKSCGTSCANSRIDPNTGLSKNDTISSTLKNNRAKINPVTGIKVSTEIANKLKETISKKDEDGLTIPQKRALKVIEMNKEIDPIAGVKRMDGIKTKLNETMSKIDEESGLTKQELSTIKTSNTMNFVDEESGLTKNELRGLEISKSLATINEETGLTRSQEIGIKVKTTLSKIDPDTNKSRYWINAQKTKKVMTEIDEETGLTKSKLQGLKTTITCDLKAVDRMTNNIPEGYTLISSTTTDNKRVAKYECNKCNSIRDSYWPYIRCTTCYPYNKSIGENEVFEYCQSIVDNVESNNRQVIAPLELDVYIPDKKIAIEYNGIFWHSSNSMESEDKNRHVNKTKLCKEKGIHLLHIFENEWLDPLKQNIWKSIIKNKLGSSRKIYARKTEFWPVDNATKTEFLNNNHLQGDCPSSINLGLYYNGELVALMTFGKARFDKKVDWELIRFCNVIGTSVVGGASRLLNKFRNIYKGIIVSYADKRRSDGNLYENLGFEFSHESGPNYWYWDGKSNRLESRIKYQKHKLDKMLNVFDKNMTESENMYYNGYRKIFDCGNQVWKLK